MIPSDHFVRFYNEVFKFLDARGGLADFYRAISRHQELHCLELYRELGIRGLYEYYLRIRKEENCDIDMKLLDDGHGISFHFKFCQSLAKAMDNDAGVCPKYCLHCPGWSGPLNRKAGFYYVKDIGELLKPECRTWVYDRPGPAMAKYRELCDRGLGDRLRVSFPVPENERIV